LFKGICRVHRAQVMKIRGGWTQAQDEAERVCADAADIHVGIVAEGRYQIGEIRRLRGDLDGAEDAYRQGHELGRDPEPGRRARPPPPCRAATAPPPRTRPARDTSSVAPPSRGSRSSASPRAAPTPRPR